jgi:spermidine/putrescine transport system permease protein
MWMNLLLRTYAWVTILDETGLINNFLAKFGNAPIQFMYNEKSIVFAMVYNFLPFMILPVNSVLTKMDSSVIEAAKDLGANDRKVFWKVVFPLSLPGIFSGITMVFMPAVTTFAITDILSGGKNDLIGNIVQRQFREADNWHYGATIAIILMALIVFSIIVSSKYEQEDGGGGLL